MFSSPCELHFIFLLAAKCCLFNNSRQEKILQACNIKACSITTWCFDYSMGQVWCHNLFWLCTHTHISWSWTLTRLEVLGYFLLLYHLPILLPFLFINFFLLSFFTSVYNFCIRVLFIIFIFYFFNGYKLSMNMHTLT